MLRALTVCAWLVALPMLGNAQAQAPIGGAVDGLPGVEDVGGPWLPEGLSLVGGLDYGRGGSVPGTDAPAYDRLGLDLAGALRVHRLVAVAAHTRMRTDLQGGSTGGFAMYTELLGRILGGEFGPWRLGGEAAVLVPQANSARVFSGLGLQVLGQAAWQADARLTLLGQLGLRLDRARHAVEDIERVSANDRATLGIGSGHVLPIGLGAHYAAGPLHVLGEWSWEPRFGGDAPSLKDATMWWRAGVRYPLSRSAALTVLAALNSATRPALTEPGPPQDIAPRFAVAARFSLALGAPVGGRDASQAGTAVEEAPKAAPEPVVEAPKTVDFTTRVLDLDGQPVPGAQVVLAREDAEQATVSDETGAARIAALPPGDWTLRVTAVGMEPSEQVVTLSVGGEPVLPELRLSPQLPEGQIRGTVRAFDGAPLRATVVVTPLGQRVRADEHGEFRVDVPPGEYVVKVTAPGYGPQQRPALVEENGVTVLIIDLRSSR